MSGTGRTYRFPARDRTGWLIGLQAAQCVILGIGVFVGGVLLNLGAPAPVILVVAVASVVAAFAPLGGRPGYSWLPVAVSWAAGRRQGVWVASVPRFGLGGPVREQPDWPGFLDGIELHEREGWRPGSTMGVVVDRRSSTATAMLRVAGREFALIDRAEQERLLGGWGDALAAFCKERSPVEAVRWFEWSAPADPAEHVRWSRDHIGPSADPATVDTYLDLVGSAGAMSTRHETLVSVTVAASVGRGLLRRRGERRADRGVDTLRDELRLLSNRLYATGLVVDPPVTTAELVGVLRTRLDPFAAKVSASGRRTLAEMAGLARAGHAGPMATRREWNRVVVDGAVHAAFAVVEWPRLDVPANWMEALLLHAGGVRTVAVHMEPVPPSTSQRRVDKDSTRLTVDAEQRARSGFRIGARHQRAEADVAAREAELVAGYAELEFCALVAVSAPDTECLERSCAEWEQVAGQAGLVLRRLNGQHDTALACSLPVGIGPSRGSWE